jgi:ATP-dependent helicase/nuclease subunit B
MGLRFIYGRGGSGKSHRCLEEIKAAVDGKAAHPLILFVPEQFSFQAERNLIEYIGERANTKVEVLSFKALAHRVFDVLGGATHRHINSAGKCMLIHRILEEIKGDLTVFSRVVKQPGFSNVLSDIITEFKRYNISPEMLSAASEGLKDNVPLSNKLRDLNNIYGTFEYNLHKGFIDSEDEITLLIEKLDQCSLFDGAELWIDEFSGFTPLQYLVLEKLMKKARQVNITLTTDCLNGASEADNTDVYAPIKNTESKLLNIIRANNISYEEPVCLEEDPLPRFRYSPELHHLERYYYSFPYICYDKPTKDISLFKALNTYTEIEKVAGEIISLSRDSGLRFKEIAVVSRDLKAYEKLIQVIFEQYGIPYFIDRKREITGNPLIVLILSAFELLNRNWSYETVFRYLKTGLVNVEREEIDLIENYVLANGIKGKRWTEEEFWDYKLSYGFDKEETSLYEQGVINRVNEIREKIIAPLKKLQGTIKGKARIKDICTAIYEFLRDIEVPDRIEKWIDSFKNQGDYAKSSEYSQILKIVMQVLDQMVEVLGDEVITSDLFIKILNVGFMEYEIGIIPPALDQVLVGSAERVRSHNIKALFVVGVNDGVFPSASNEEGLLSDMDRAALKDLGVELAADTRSKAFEEQLLVYTTLTMPCNYIKLSYPIANFEGKTLRPSAIISRIKKIYPRILDENDILEAETPQQSMEFVAAPVPAFNKMIASLRKGFEGGTVEEVWRDVYRWYGQQEEWSEKSERALQGLTYTNQVEDVNETKIKELYGENLSFSVSRLERYSECAFSYFIQYGIKAKDRKVYELSPPDIGTFMHEVLDKFSDRVSESGMNWREVTREWSSSTISTIVDEILENKSSSILNSSARYKYITDRLKQIVAKSVEIISEHIRRSDFDPLGNELVFGRGGDLPPIDISLPSGDKVSLIGRIDRVDRMDAEEGIYLRIIDYKTGSKDFNLSDVYYGLQLQLLLYLDALLKNADKYLEKQALPGAILYFKLDDPLVKGNTEMTEEEIEKNIMKKLKMKGLLLADARLVKGMDKNMEGYSLMIPAKANKDGSIGSTSAVTLEQFEILRRYVSDSVVRLSQEMLKGNIKIKPSKKKSYVSCDWCQYSSVCQFDTEIMDNKFRYVNDKSDEKVWELIKKKLGMEGEELDLEALAEEATGGDL